MILSLGSLNIDHVYQVDHIARSGETLACHRYDQFSGGKGLNQSIAAARAGASVKHVGCMGQDGVWLAELMRESRIDVAGIQVRDVPTGHAMIQVSRQGDNSIVIHGGANREVAPVQLREAFEEPSISWLLLQNETNLVMEAMEMAVRRGIPIALNPAPVDARVMHEYPLSQVSLLIVNEVEAELLTGQTSKADMLDQLHAKYPDTVVVLTLGREGASVISRSGTLTQRGHEVDVVDTTAAGDTFVGYFVACLDRGGALEQALKEANQAAAQCVTRVGAAPSIPQYGELAFS